MKSADLLVVFTRFPVPGQTKTRLIPALGAEGAAELQRAMTEHTIENVRAAESEWVLDIRFDGGSKAQMRDWLGEALNYTEQGDGDLGDRLRRAFEAAFTSGAARVAAIGIDCPDVNTQHIRACFEALDEADAVIGPATDGGYYLIGLAAPVAEPGLDAILTDMPWGTGCVLQRTREALSLAKLSHTELDALDDVDRPKDMAVWERARRDDTDSGE